jgi:16S rRNA (cytidine1402-2'-O)-methyltransferase
MDGVLYVLATPLGNLDDMTHRGAAALREADLVAAEDTRRTRKLMVHFGAKAPLISYREENHFRVWPKIADALEKGRRVILATDAGTPGVSDPGRLAVSEAMKMGARVLPLPGPSAVAAALSVSGLDADAYVFAGFPPAKAAARGKFYQGLRYERKTLVFFEAPHRLGDSLADAADVLGPRQAMLGREMTKMNEEYRPSDLASLARDLPPGIEVKGEITLVVAGAAGDEEPLGREELIELIRADDRPVKTLAAELSGPAGLSRSDLYRLILEVRRDRSS